MIIGKQVHFPQKKQQKDWSQEERVITRCGHQIVWKYVQAAHFYTSSGSCRRDQIWRSLHVTLKQNQFTLR